VRWVEGVNWHAALHTSNKLKSAGRTNWDMWPRSAIVTPLALKGLLDVSFVTEHSS